MILIDANLLVYAYVESQPQHRSIVRWLEDCLNGTTIVGLPWESLLAFLRLVTNPRIFGRPATIDAGWAQIELWLSSPVARVPLPGDRHRQVLAPLIRATGGRSNLIPDAHLAAVAIEHGYTLYSVDGDFARFPGLRWQNPLTGTGSE